MKKKIHIDLIWYEKSEYVSQHEENEWLLGQAAWLNEKEIKYRGYLILKNENLNLLYRGGKQTQYGFVCVKHCIQKSNL